jgi:hypothetical protein
VAVSWFPEEAHLLPDVEMSNSGRLSTSYPKLTNQPPASTRETEDRQVREVKWSEVKQGDAEVILRDDYPCGNKAHFVRISLGREEQDW